MARKQGSHSDITGPRLRAAAQALIAQHGYAAVSMRQIAAEVGVQAGALYNYIADKQSLLFDLLKSHMDEALAALQAVPLQGPPDAALRRFVQFHIRFNYPRRDAVFLSYMELRNLDSANFEQIAVMRRAYEDVIEDILKRGVTLGVFAIPDTRIAVLSMIAQLNGVTNWFDPGGRLSIDEVADIHESLVLKSVAA